MSHSIRLPFFPVPASGETVFSVVGRCSERLGIADSHLLTLLSGQRNSTTLFSALPGYLEKISMAMPDGHPWQNTTDLINLHTALPYFIYFHPQKLREASIELLARAPNAQPTMLRLGLSTYKVPASPKHPRFCITCLQEQSFDPGHTYFHLAHQLPAITHCWHHGEVLSNGCVTCGPYPIKGKKLTMPGQCLCHAFTANSLESANENSEAAFWLARESAYLLTSTDSQDNRWQRLRDSVVKAGLSRGSLLDYVRLAKAVETRFGEDFLNSINYPAWDNAGKPSAWIRRCFSAAESGKQIPSIVGLLVLGTVFDSVKAFEEGDISNRHQGLKKQPTMESPQQRPAAWASNLQDALEKHEYRISTCAAALDQTSWNIAIEARKQNIAIPLSAQAIARIGSGRLTMIREQLRQGVTKKEILNAHRISEWTLLLIELDDPQLSREHRAATAVLLRDKHRECVTKFMKANPAATRQTIFERLSGAYDFLVSKDKAWFHENIPKTASKKVGGRPKRIDWEATDSSLAKAILATKDQPLTSDKRPQRITATLLLKKYRALQKYTTHPFRFPLTQKAIDVTAETPEEHLKRKVRWGIQRLTDSKQNISMNLLRREIAVSDTKLKQRLPMIRRILKELGASVSETSILHE